MKVKIFGLGKQGSAVAYAMNKLGYDVFVYEQAESCFEVAKKRLAKLGCNVIQDDSNSKDFNVIVSCLPYSCNIPIATFAAKNRIPYCDLGGNPAISKQIIDIGKEHGSLTFPDLGLAPGLINIVAADLVKTNKNLSLLVGGLPMEPEGRLQYAQVFSIDGLYNEYVGEDKIVVNGKVKTVKTLSDVRTYYFKETKEIKYPYLQGAYTKGGLGNSLDDFIAHGVENYEYRTLRNTNHFDYISFLLNDCKLNEQEFKKVIEAACPETKKDCVMMGIKSGEKLWGQLVVYDDKWTAMQKTTAFPAAVVANLIAQGKVNSSSYFDIPFQEFKIDLEKLGILLDPFN